MIIRATKKPVEVEAFHYTAPNEIKEISEWLGIEEPKLEHNNFFWIFLEDAVIQVRVEFGDWIIKSPEGKIFILPNADFTSLYDYKLWEGNEK